MSILRSNLQLKTAPCFGLWRTLVPCIEFTLSCIIPSGIGVFIARSFVLPCPLARAQYLAHRLLSVFTAPAQGHGFDRTITMILHCMYLACAAGLLALSSAQDGISAMGVSATAGMSAAEPVPFDWSLGATTTTSEDAFRFEDEITMVLDSPPEMWDSPLRVRQPVLRSCRAAPGPRACLPDPAAQAR